MDALYEPRFAYPIAAACGVGVLAAVRAALRRFREAQRAEPGNARSLALVRAVRGGILAIGLGALAGGLLTRTGWAVLFALVFIGEEMLEVGTYALALKAAAKRDTRRPAPRTSAVPQPPAGGAGAGAADAGAADPGAAGAAAGGRP